MQFLTAVKQNLEMLTGSRSAGFKAVLKGSVTTNIQPMSVQGLAATGQVSVISNIPVPSYNDYVSLIKDVAALREELARTKAELASLVRNLKA